jgi:hypothetical protein
VLELGPLISKIPPEVGFVMTLVGLTGRIVSIAMGENSETQNAQYPNGYGNYQECTKHSNSTFNCNYDNIVIL